MMLVSTPLFADEPGFLSKVTNIMGCEAWTRPEPLPDRKPVLLQLRNLASRIKLLAQLVPPQQFNLLTGSTTQELDNRLTEIAGFLLETKANAIKAKDLQEQLDALEDRIMESLNANQKLIVTAADVSPSYNASVLVTEPRGDSQYGRPMGFKQYGPGQAKP